jgi:hypothetical protein
VKKNLYFSRSLIVIVIWKKKKKKKKINNKTCHARVFMLQVAEFEIVRLLLLWRRT